MQTDAWFDLCGVPAFSNALASDIATARMMAEIWHQNERPVALARISEMASA